MSDTTYNYGNDAQGHPVYESSSPSGMAAPTSAVSAQTVNSTNLAPASTTNYTQPEQSPVPDISGLETKYTPLEATPQEGQASALTKELQGINTQLAGKDAYQTQQENAAGVDQITQAINDNNTAVKTLQHDSSIAKLNQENRLAPTFAISGEQGAIDRATAVKALTLSSISDVLQNNLVAAQAKADRAVKAQYGPLEAELKAKTANLQLILNDPATSLADKNRATQQQLVLNQQAAQIADAKATTQGVQKLAIEAGQNAKTFTATPQYPTLSTALHAIATAKTVEDAVAIQTATGLGTPAKLDTSMTEIGGRRVLVNNQTGAIIRDLGSAATYSELHPSSGAGTEGSDLNFARDYLTNNPGTDPNKAKQDFLARHPSAGSAWDNYWGISAANPTGNFPQAPAPAKSSLFGLGFWGL